jgi:hypothetical protein
MDRVIGKRFFLHLAWATICPNGVAGLGELGCCLAVNDM